MNEDYSGSYFPVHIDLGRVPEPFPEGTGLDLPERSKKKYYPTLYVSDVKGLADLPKKGWALIEFDRADLSLRRTDDGDRVSAELKIKTLCLPEGSGDDGESLESILKRALDGSEENNEEDDE